MNSYVEILLIGIFTAVSCAIVGNFLVLRRLSMLTDAISHTVLLGIVLAFLGTHNLDSPLLIIGATLMGVFTVWSIEMLIQSKIVSSDAAIGVTFPLLFSIAIILITKFANTVHLDVDSVILGELAFTPFNRWYIDSIDMGPVALYVSFITLVLVVVYIFFFYKELLITTFDAVHAATLGISSTLIHYTFMSLVSLTAVTSFESIGSILVVSFMVTPTLTASLWTNRLSSRIYVSGLIASIATAVGFYISLVLDASIGGSIATVNGIILFAASLLIQLNKKKAKS